MAINGGGEKVETFTIGVVEQGKILFLKESLKVAMLLLTSHYILESWFRLVVC